MKVTSKNKTNILVVGGGIAGLATAYKLINDSRWSNVNMHVTLVERKARYGGRIKTIQLENAKRWYEAGASRVADTHTHVRALATQIGCKEIRLPESYDRRSVMPALHKAFRRVHTAFVKRYGEDSLKSISWWDVLTIVCNEKQRYQFAQDWGFLSVLKEMNAFDFWHYAMPQYLCATYYTFDGGLSSIVQNLSRILEKSDKVTLLPSTRATQIRVHQSNTSASPSPFKTTQLQVSLQDDNDASLYHAHHERQRTAIYDMVFLALPSEALSTLKGIPEMYAHFWTSVSRNRLLRCYAKYPTSTNIRSTHRFTKSKKRKTEITPTKTRKKNIDISVLCKRRVKSSVLNKCTTTHAPEWYQVAYCDHTKADHLYNILRMPHGLKHFKSVVRKVLGASWASFDDSHFDVHYWKAGTHSWKPQLLSDNHYQRILQPDAKVPLFVVGASFSHYQHWMEGALETVHDAYAKCWRYAVEWLGAGASKKRFSNTHKKFTCEKTSRCFVDPFYLHNACASDEKVYTVDDVAANQWVILDGYVYDVEPFVDRHPGGRALLQNMLGKDISIPYHRIGHSSIARAWAEENCKGVLKQKTFTTETQTR